jgi:hypothetical protein
LAIPVEGAIYVSSLPFDGLRRHFGGLSGIAFPPQIKFIKMAPFLGPLVKRQIGRIVREGDARCRSGKQNGKTGVVENKGRE